MWLKFLIFSILFNILSASPPGYRASASDQSDKGNWNSRDDEKNQPTTSSIHPNNYYFGSKPQRTPLDLSTKNRQPDRSAAPSTSGAKKIFFDCSQCDKSYTTARSLTRHVRSQHEGKTFDCTKCGQKYTSNRNLEDHDRAKHQGKTFDCEKCSRKYASKSNLIHHDKAEHQEHNEMLTCDKCPYQTKRRNTLYKHKSRSH